MNQVSRLRGRLEDVFGFKRFDPADLRVLKMFAGGHLDSSQLSTARHVLRQGIERWGDQDGSVSLTDVTKISALGRQTLANCLQQLASRGLVAPMGRGRWTCLVDEIDHGITDRLADEARQRSEDRQIALQQMVRFAEEHHCRWDKLLNHFGDDGSLDLSYCRCDVCEPSVVNEA